MSYLPGTGFVMVLIVYAIVTYFFIWGFSTPDLDRVWTIYHEFKIGRIEQLKDNDRKILTKLMVKHPELTEEFLNGKSIGLISENNNGSVIGPVATILRTTDKKKNKTILIKVLESIYFRPFTLTIQGNGGNTGKWLWKKSLKISKTGSIEIDLPEINEKTEIIEIQLRSNILANITFPVSNLNKVRKGES